MLNLFQHLMYVCPNNKEIPKRYKMSQRGTSCANLYAAAVRNDNRVFAFTLAEVLITLVIVGVVAALTLPTLMTKYQQHVFANQFKKSLYTISQIVANTRSELGVSKLAQYCTEYDQSYYNAPECYTEINEYIKKVKKQFRPYSSTMGFYNINRNNEIIKTYNDKNNFTHLDANLNSLFFVNQLSDGSFLGYNINGGQLSFGVDLNGYKKPNRLGYDIFIFAVNKTNDTITTFQNRTPTNASDDDAANYASENFENSPSKNYLEQTYGTPCNLESTRVGNGLGCAYYALRNKCPYDDTKTYWECLK